MVMQNEEILRFIAHYQSSIEKNLRNESRLLHCIKKLDTLALQVDHLQATGVGRTLNSLRKMPNEVGPAAIALVNKWKLMVMEDTHEANVDPPAPLTPPADEENQHDVEQDNDDPDEDAGRGDSIEDSDVDIDEDKEIRLEIDCAAEAEYKLETTDEPEEQHEEKKSSRSPSEQRHHHKRHSSQKHEKHSHRHGKKKGEKRRSRHNDDKSSSSRDARSASSSSSSNEDNKRREKKHRHEKASGSKSSKSRHEKSRHESKSSSRHKKNGSVSRSEQSHSKHESSERRHSKHESMKHESKSPQKRPANAELTNDAKRRKHEHSERAETPSHSSSKSHAETTSTPHKSKEKPSTSGGSGTIKTEHKSSKPKDTPEKSTKSKSGHNIDDENGIDSKHGANFADVLAMIDVRKPQKPKKTKGIESGNTPVRKEEVAGSSSKSNHSSTAEKSSTKPLPNFKLEPLELNLFEKEQTFDYNYKPHSATQMELMASLATKIVKPTSFSMGERPKLTVSEAQRESELIVQGITSKTTRTKVYSGVVKGMQPPTLFEACSRFMLRNFDAIEYTGGVPYEVLKHILERVSYQQLFTFEAYNPYIIEDTEALWQNHVRLNFRGEKPIGKETWRDAFIRVTKEKETKLNNITAAIMKQQKLKEEPKRRTKMAFVDSFVKPPLNVQRKQEAFGTRNKLIATPAARVASLAGVTPNATQIGDKRLKVAPYVPDTASQSGSSTARPTDRAPLMKKALSMMRKYRQ